MTSPAIRMRPRLELRLAGRMGRMRGGTVMGPGEVRRVSRAIGLDCCLDSDRAPVTCSAMAARDWAISAAVSGVGSVVGLLSGVFATRLLGRIVYQANPRDPVVVGGAVLTMALLGIAASAIPALRALAVDPSKLMREE